jgi:hypothetical protein
MSTKFLPINSKSESGVAKKKSQPSKTPLVGAVVGIGLACAGAGFFAGKNSATISRSVATLTGSEKAEAPAKAAVEPRRAEAHAVKQADRAELAHIAKAAEPKAAETKSAEPRTATPEIPVPPAKPEIAKPADVKPDIGEQAPPIAFALVDREVSQSVEEGEKVTFSLNFENLSGKPIRAFEGVVKLTDQRDNPIFSSKISVSALISEGGALHWDQHVDARKLDAKGKRIVSEDKENLKAVFLVKRVFFVDGSVQKYGAKG